MPLSNPVLWAAICDRVLPFRPERDGLADPPRECTRFEQNLAKAGHWTDESAARLVEEYRRFEYLAKLSVRPVVPPPLIAQVGRLLAGMGHQAVAPALGGAMPYAGLRTDYQREFGQMPPPDIWPSDRALAWGYRRKWMLWVGWVGFFGLALLGIFGPLLLGLVQERNLLSAEILSVIAAFFAGDLGPDRKTIETAVGVAIFGFAGLAMVGDLVKPRQPPRRPFE
jgi:hypothetical protein